MTGVALHRKSLSHCFPTGMASALVGRMELQLRWMRRWSAPPPTNASVRCSGPRLKMWLLTDRNGKLLLRSTLGPNMTVAEDLHPNSHPSPFSLPTNPRCPVRGLRRAWRLPPCCRPWITCRPRPRARPMRRCHGAEDGRGSERMGQCQVPSSNGAMRSFGGRRLKPWFLATP